MSAIRLFDKFQKLLDVTWGSIADGQTLKRSGSNIIGYTPGGGSGDVVGPASSVNNEIALFSGTGGKTIQRATGTGYVTVISGVYQTPTAVDSVGRMPRGHIWGLTLSNNGTDAVNDIDIAVGEARNSTNLVDMVLASALTKRLDAAWAVGTNQGGLDTGTIANNTYHVHLIERTDGTVVDALFSLSATAPTMPANYTFFRRIGSIMRVGATIRAFSQLGEEFLWKVPTFDIAVSNLGTTATSYTLAVPIGIQVTARLYVDMSHATANTTIYLSSLDQTDTAATTIYSLFNDFAAGWGITEMQLRTTTSGQIRARSEAATTSLNMITNGWRDDRGRNY